MFQGVQTAPSYAFFAFFLLFLGVLGLSLPVQGKIFRNSYFSFQLPDGWACRQNDNDLGWTCQNVVRSDKKTEAAILILAKEAGPQDNFQRYQETLKKPLKNRHLLKPSEVQRFNPKKIVSFHTWIDSLHYEGAIQQYYTRYLATKKNELAILVTFTAHKDLYAQYSSDFIRAIQSMKIVAPKDYLRVAKVKAQGKSGSIIGNINESSFASLDEPTETPKKNYGVLYALIFLLLSAGLWFFFLRKKRQRS